MKLEISGLVSQSEVVLHQFGFGRVKRHLVAQEPAFISQNRCRVHNRTLEINVAAHIDEVTLVASLQFTALLAKERITLSKKSNEIIKPALMSQILTTHPVFGTKDVSRATFNPCVS